MNIILVTPDDFIGEQTVRIDDQRAKHIKDVHQAEPGRRLKVGLMNGLMGMGEVIEAGDSGVVLELLLDRHPPQKLPLTVVLALPRPKMLRRIIQSLSSLGVRKLVLINSYRVEKSYWQSPFLNQLDDYVRLGLEQCVDTVPMQITLEKRFKPFVEDRLEALSENSLKLVAHPYVDRVCPRNVEQATTLVIGPEGGFIDYEVDKLAAVGFEPVSLGDRIQKVETVLPQLIGRLF